MGKCKALYAARLEKQRMYELMVGFGVELGASHTIAEQELAEVVVVVFG